MLIIFDLDDTLLDTSNSFFPKRLRWALLQLYSCGYNIQVDKTFAQIIELKRSFTTRIACSKVLNANMCKKLFSFIYDRRMRKEESIEVFPGVMGLLKSLDAHELFIVTYGNILLQHDKIERSGIDTSRFSKIIVDEQGIKKKHYASIVYNRKAFVVGDKIDRDLRPARELGLCTVHVSKKKQVESDCVDFVIGDIVELSGIVIP